MQTRLSGILSYFTRHGTAANLLLVLLIAVGITVIPKMRAQFFPDVIVDNVRVNVAWDGAGADNIDDAVVAVLEPSLLVVEGVTGSSAISREGSTTITLEFEPGWDMSRAADDVQVAVDSVTTLPEGLEEPVVRRGAWRDRVTDVVIYGPVGVDQLARFADEFSARLFQEGISRTTIRGVAAPRTVIEVPTLSLIQHDVSMAEIADAIRGEAGTAPAGDVAGANARVRTGVAKRSPEELRSIVLRSSQDGSVLTVGDVGLVISEGVDRNRAYFVGDQPAMSIRVDRNEQGDAIGIQAKVAEVAEEMEKTLPNGVKVELIRTRAEAITTRLNILLDNGLLGLGLVVGLLFLFLNARTAFWVAAGIPVAMMAAITLMYIGGLTLNMVSLFALIITLGIVVDDAIVVGEHADFRASKLGEAPIAAAENAARRMAPPVFSATITTVIAFFGLTAIGGRFGNVIADIPFTVIAVLLASLVECFLILPNHMAHALTHTAKSHWYDWPSRQVTRGLNWFKRAIFRRLMAIVIRARYPLVAGLIVILMMQVAVFVRGDVQWRFFNAPERSSVSGNFAMLEGASRADTIEMMLRVQKATEELGKKYEDEYGTNPLDFVLSEVGGTTGRGLSGTDTKDPDLLGSIAIELIDADLRPYSSYQFVGELQDAVPRHPMLETISFRSYRSGPGGDTLHVDFYGATTETLKSAAEALKTAVAQFPEVSAVEDTLAYDKDEFTIDLTAQGAALGFDIDGLSRVLRNRLNGIEAATYPDGNRSAAIRVELPESELTADFLESMLLRSNTGSYVPLADLVSVDMNTGFSTIRRENGLRTVSVTGDISEDDSARAEFIIEELEERILPEIESTYGVVYRIAGLAEQEREFLNDALFGFMLCNVGIYLCLAWIFSSWTRPVVVLAIVPFGLVGTIYGHQAWEVPLSMFTVVGLIGMTGIIINDSIVLVTTIDEYQKTRGLIPAIIDGTTDRLRPVMLTTMTTVLGLTPLLFEGSQQAQFLKPTVITLVYGLGFGFFVVLLLVPALVAMQRDVTQQVDAVRRAFRHPARSGLVGLIVPAVAILLGSGFLLTLGWFAMSETLPVQVVAQLPSSVSPSPALSLALFLASAATITLLAWLAGILAIALQRRARRS
jgi:multidrug efflux pump subunit AcrB